jgi:TolA-binding protein
MGTVTYPHPEVERELGERFVPCRLESAKHPELARAMNVRWLPALIVAAADGRPAHVQTSFLAPQDLLVELEFGRAIHAMGEKRYDDAHALFETVAARGGERAPDACYWWGISQYRQSKDFRDCQRRWAEIAKRWPDTQWARRVSYAL